MGGPEFNPHILLGKASTLRNWDSIPLPKRRLKVKGFISYEVGKVRFKPVLKSSFKTVGPAGGPSSVVGDFIEAAEVVGIFLEIRVLFLVGNVLECPDER